MVPLEARFLRPSVMGVVNVTPDSFSDGGVNFAPDDAVSEVIAFLEERLEFAVGAGIAEQRICLDPGIGFGKTPEQNFELVRRLDVLLALGRPVLVGFSRKSSLGRLVRDPEAQVGTTAAS